MSNFFKDNENLKFHYENIDIDEVIQILENNFEDAKTYDYAPRNLNEAKKTYREALNIIGDITANVVAKNAESVDEEGAEFKDGCVTYAKGTRENLKTLLNSDFGGITIPRRYGGLNFPTTVSTMIIEMVSRADASLMNLVGLQDIGETINDFADEEIKKKYLPLFTSGKVTGAMALTEPDAGSDLQAVQTKAIFDEKNNTWKLYGVKRFITNGCAEISLVLARSEMGSKDGRGLSMFLVEKDETTQIRRIENKHGIHGSPTCELQYNGTPAILIGKRKMGLIRYVMSLMNGARLAVSAQGIGIAEAAYREALKYAKERVQFGEAIINFPAVYDMLTRMKVKIEGSRSLVYETCKYVDLKKVYTLLSERDTTNQEYKILLKKYTSFAALLTPMSKAYSSEMSNQVAYDAVQVHAGTGFMKEFPVERLSRDARITNIYEGTTQLQVIAAIGGIINGTLDELLNEYDQKIKENELLSKIRENLTKCINKYKELQKDLQSYIARDITDLACELFISYRLIILAKDDRTRIIARAFKENTYLNSIKTTTKILNLNTTMVDNRDIILS